MGEKEKEFWTLVDMRRKIKIYILHGWAYTIEKWKPLIDLLRENGYEVKLLKIPGLTAPLDEIWDLDDYVGWMEDILRTEKDKVILMGHSNGGRIASVYCFRNPDKVNKLILIDSGGIYHNEIPIRIKRFVFANLAKLGRKFTNSEYFRKLLYKLTRESDYERANSVLRKTMQNLIRVDVSEVFGKLDLPVTIIWGEKDGITPIKDGYKIHELIKGSSFYVIKEARHSPMFTHVEEVGEVILKVTR